MRIEREERELVAVISERLNGYWHKRSDGSGGFTSFDDLTRSRKSDCLPLKRTFETQRKLHENSIKAIYKGDKVIIDVERTITEEKEIQF